MSPSPPFPRVLPPRDVVARAMSEQALLEAVIELAHVRGWRCAHFRPARTERGWRTAVSADGAGWPDLLLCRGPRIVAAELKAMGGRFGAEQKAWLAALDTAGVETYVWRPSSWRDGTIEVILA